MTTKQRPTGNTLPAISQKVLVELLETSRQAIANWEKAGMPFHRRDGRKYYDLAVILPWLKRRWLTGEEGDQKRAAEIKLLIRREVALQLKMQVMTGELMPREQVESENVQKVLAFRAGLEALGKAIAPAVLELAAEPDVRTDQVEQLIHDYVDSLLRHYAGEK